jgi:propionyl-CoA carboxylase alpha chain
MPGTVVRVLAEAGASVTSGQPLIVLESMKMERTMTAPGDGTVIDLNVRPGDQIDAGRVLAVVDPVTRRGV